MIENKENTTEEKNTRTEKKETPERSSRDNREHSGRNSGRPRSSRRDKSKFFLRKKVCYFCKNKDVVIDYKDVNLMRRFIAESGKIVPRRFSGTCAKHQRKLSTEIKKARQMALIPYTDR